MEELQPEQGKYPKMERAECSDGCCPKHGCGAHPPERQRATILILEEVPSDGARLAELAFSSPVAHEAHETDPIESSGTMPAGSAVGMLLYFTGPSLKSSPNNWLVQGAQGEVVGPARAKCFMGKGVAVKFPNNRTSVDCSLDELSREPPTLAAPVA